MEEELWTDGHMSVYLSGDGNVQIRAEIHEQIKAFNNAVSEAHRRARKPGSVRALHVLLRDVEGNLRGGLIADTYWDWLDVDDFWVEEAVRGSGWGSRMLRAAEEEAIARGCSHVKLETFTFQAREFYEKWGYRVVGRLENYPPGHSLFWMTKDLHEENPAKR